MPTDFPRSSSGLEVGDLDEEARLEGPTAVSTPVRNTASSSLSPVKDIEKSKHDALLAGSLPEGEGQPVTDIISGTEEPIIVTFNRPYDADNPYQWSRFKKIRIAVLVLTYALVRLSLPCPPWLLSQD